MEKHSLIIRPVELKDAGQINLLRRIPELAENMLALPSETIADNEDFIRKKTTDDHLFCAELIDEQGARLVGMAGLHIRKNMRMRHSAALGIMVHKDFHGRGIGRRLMETLLDLSDNWLMLKRVDLTVFTENERAIRLYESCGFIKEGLQKYAAIRNGSFADIYLMARYGKS